MVKFNVPFFVKHKTMPIRHAIVKLIAPKMHADWESLHRIIGETPRPMIKFLKQRCNGGLVGAEIGVCYGNNAYSILQELPINRLYLIDHYEPYFECGQLKKYAHTAEQEAKSKLSQFNDRIRFVKKKSVDAVGDLEECDFVYIDANHGFEDVKADLEAYYPLVKEGGVLGGHDYTVMFLGLVQAVNQFVRAHNFMEGVNFFHVFPDWWIIKEE